MTVKVVNSDNQSIANAEVEIFEKYRRLIPTAFKGKTDAEGVVRFDGVALEGYAYLVVRHPDFAPMMQYLALAGQDDVTTTIRLAPATQTFVDVLTPDGKPLVGAQVMSLEFSSELTGGNHFANHEFFQALMQSDGTVFTSDSQGRLQLPPLPTDAVLSLKVTHPQYTVGAIENVKLSELADSKLALGRGTTVEAYLVGEPEVLQKLEGEQVEFRTFNREKERLNHSFEIQNGKFEFSVVPGQYDGLNVFHSTDLVITPSLPSSWNLAEFMRIPAIDRLEKKFVVRELHSVSGKVVLADGTPVSGLELDVEYENLYVDEEGKRQVVPEHPRKSDFVTTKFDGSFECNIPSGNVWISTGWSSGYLSTPDKLEMVFDGQAELPDYVVKPMPTLKGIAVDESGEPIPNVVLRLVDQTNHYVFADEQGRFEIPVTLMDLEPDFETRSKFKMLSAFDLGSRLCCIEKIDITDDDAVANIKLELKNHPVNWLMDRFMEISGQRIERMLARSNYMKEEFDREQKQREEFKVSHKFAPDLTNGTWLGEKGGRSLNEFRGKYVLLDFWFIGCGPCEREMPNLKLAYQKFKDRNFCVIGIHTAGQSAEVVERYMADRMMEYPMVIDRYDEAIVKSYEELGLTGFPTYFLITPTGEIDWDTYVHGETLEIIRDRILTMEEEDAEGEK
ncbi:MAG: redoxin domain-containing protein [Pirellulaceae bacterium]